MKAQHSHQSQCRRVIRPTDLIPGRPVGPRMFFQQKANAQTRPGTACCAAQAICFVRWPSLDLSLSDFLHDWIQVMHFCQKYQKSGAVPPLGSVRQEARVPICPFAGGGAVGPSGCSSEVTVHSALQELCGEMLQDDANTLSFRAALMQ